MSHRLFPCVVLLAAVTTSGCAQLQPFLPTVSFNRLDVTEVDWEAISTDFVFNVQNPNPVGIDLATFDYALAFEGIEFLSGDSPDGLALPSVWDTTEAVEVALPVSLDFQGLYDMVQAVTGEDTIGFSLSGGFGFDTGDALGVITIPYNAEGGFPALRSPGIDLGKLELLGVAGTMASLTLGLELANDHGSNIFFQNFDYEIEASGEPIFSGLIEDLAEVEGAESGGEAATRTVDLPINVDLLGAGAVLWDAVYNGNSVNVGLGAATDVDTPFGVLPLSIDQSGNLSL